jgi:hypothetical protein
MKNSIIFIMLASLSILGCTKGAGPGGRATIKGKVWATNLTNSLITESDSAYQGNVQVFISYGDNPSVGDDVRTGYDGTYQFDYLRPGNYKLWTYSKIRFSENRLDSAAVKEITITGNKEVKVVEDFRIYTSKN